MSDKDDLDRLQDSFGSDPNPSMVNELFGEGSIVVQLQMRPITLASIALLERIDSQLINGNPIIHTPEMVLECCKFIALQTGTLKEAQALSRDRDALDDRAFEIADKIGPSRAEEVLNEITAMLKDATDTQVVPVVEEADRQVDDDDEPGNDSGHRGESD